MAWMDNQISANDFDSIRLSVASREDILNWSYGEVLRPETINYRTQKPERDGLFCERIFGPVKDINPHDAKFKGVRSREAAVDKEGNLVTKSISRRERMGHISLAVPVAHTWFVRGTPSALGLLLDLTVKNIERVVYFAAYLITDVDAEKINTTRDELVASHKAAQEAIAARYDAAIKEEGADVDKLEREQQKELDDLENDFTMQLESFWPFRNDATVYSCDFGRSLFFTHGAGDESEHSRTPDNDIASLHFSGQAQRPRHCGHGAIDDASHRQGNVCRQGKNGRVAAQNDVFGKSAVQCALRCHLLVAVFEQVGGFLGDALACHLAVRGSGVNGPRDPFPYA